jgi:outer membrane lipoprotein-sorting protein
MITIKKYLAMLMIVAAGLCLGWADTFEGIRAAAGTVTSVQARFVQEKHLPILARPLTARGRFMFQGPDSLRWEYEAPVRSVLLMHNGRTRRFIESDGKMVPESTAGLQTMDVVSEQITHWLSGRFDQNPLFEASLAPGRKIVLTPRNRQMGQFILRMEMVMGDQPGVMQEVVIFESETAYTRFRFIEPLINQPLSPSAFEQVP